MNPEEDRSVWVLVWLIVLTFVLMLFTACSGLKMDGECVHVRTVTTSYTCAPTGKMEHIRIAPTEVE